MVPVSDVPEHVILHRMPTTPAGLNEDQTPDTGAETFVKDLLNHKFGKTLREELGIGVDDLPSHAIPLGIFGALEWIALCGWWAWTYTGIYHSSETYKWVYKYSSWDKDEDDWIVYEFDPDRIMKFQENAEENHFEERWGDPGLTEKERREATQFLINDVYEAMDKEAPDQMVVEMILWCTFMWVLSENGRTWLCEVDPVWNCVDDFGVAFLEQWENMLLDPRNVECTEREIGSCFSCGNSLHCVAGAAIGKHWVNICNHCLCNGHDIDPDQVDQLDSRILKPHCPHWGETGRCLNTECPHNPISAEDVLESMQDAGTRRVESWRRNRLEADEPRKIAGRTVDDILEYFR
jgi:hypothetical protein